MAKCVCNTDLKKRHTEPPLETFTLGRLVVQLLG